jgi:hypothetical protein
MTLCPGDERNLNSGQHGAWCKETFEKPAKVIANEVKQSHNSVQSQGDCHVASLLAMT